MRVVKVEQLFTVNEVAWIVGVTRMTVYRMVHSGQLPAVRIGRSVRIPQSSVTRLILIRENETDLMPDP